VPGLTGVTQISVGLDTVCARLWSGTVQCWGLNDFGQVGNGVSDNEYSPVAVVGLSGAASVSTGDTNTCALLSSGAVKCWGDNSSGGLGDGTTTTVSSATSTVVW